MTSDQPAALVTRAGSVASFLPTRSDGASGCALPERTPARRFVTSAAESPPTPPSVAAGTGDVTVRPVACAGCGRFYFAEPTVCYWCRTPGSRAEPVERAAESPRKRACPSCGGGMQREDGAVCWSCAKRARELAEAAGRPDAPARAAAPRATPGREPGPEGGRASPRTPPLKRAMPAVAASPLA